MNMTNIQRYNKAIIAIIIGVVFTVLNQYGITEQSTLMEVVTTLLVAAGVYVVPNRE